MKVELRPDRSVARIGKTLTRDASAGESIGIQKVGGDAAALLWAVLDPLVARDAAHAYYEDAFQLMIDRGVCFGTVDVAPGSWIEIDDAADLAAARERFRA